MQGIAVILWYGSFAHGSRTAIHRYPVEQLQKSASRDQANERTDRTSPSDRRCVTA
jgi:hypothetical protein